MHLLGAWARPSGTPVIWHFHDFAARRRLTSKLLRRSAGRCAAIIANSRSVAEDARQVCGDALAVHPVWNAVDLGRFSPTGRDLISMRSQSCRRLMTMWCASVWSRRSHDGRGTRRFSRRCRCCRLLLPVRGYVIGGPVYETAGSQVAIDELRERAQSLGLGSRVGFTGFISDSSSAMRSLDIVVHASTDPEPFGLVIAEAMACGKAVVASRAGGAIELTEAVRRRRDAHAWRRARPGRSDSGTGHATRIFASALAHPVERPQSGASPGRAWPSSSRPSIRRWRTCTDASSPRHEREHVRRRRDVSHDAAARAASRRRWNPSSLCVSRGDSVLSSRAGLSAHRVAGGAAQPAAYSAASATCACAMLLLGIVRRRGVSPALDVRGIRLSDSCEQGSRGALGTHGG